MLIQHLLTIRLFDTIFDNPDFVRRNVIAAEVEKVIDALASKAFSREQFLKSLDRFYVAIESAARVRSPISRPEARLSLWSTIDYDPGYEFISTEGEHFTQFRVTSELGCLLI